MLLGDFNMLQSPIQPLTKGINRKLSRRFLKAVLNQMPGMAEARQP